MYTETITSVQYTFEGICQKLHEIVESEYGLLELLGVADYDDAVAKLLIQWVNINPQDMLNIQVVDHLAKMYCEDPVFRSRWSSISARFAVWLNEQTGQTCAEMSNRLYSLIVFDVQPEQDILPPVLFSTRVEVIPEEIAIGSDELFWINCFMLTRLTIENSNLISQYKQSVKENASVSIKRKTT